MPSKKCSARTQASGAFPLNNDEKISLPVSWHDRVCNALIKRRTDRRDHNRCTRPTLPPRRSQPERRLNTSRAASPSPASPVQNSHPDHHCPRGTAPRSMLPNAESTRKPLEQILVRWSRLQWGYAGKLIGALRVRKPPTSSVARSCLCFKPFESILHVSTPCASLPSTS